MLNYKPLTDEEIRQLRDFINDRPPGGEWGDLVRMGGNKAEFKRIAVKYLRWLSRGVGKIKFNPAGPAASGEAILDGDFYVMIQAIPYGILWRLDRRGANMWVSADKIGSREWYDDALRVKG